MKMQDYFDVMSKVHREKTFAVSAQITLGQLIKQIEDAGLKCKDDSPKTISFDFGSALPTRLDSWRGSYSELALGYVLSGHDGEGDYEGTTAEKLLTELKSAIGKIFTGWKGGDYVMGENTPVWVANPGNSNDTGIIGILDVGYKLVILTAYCEF